MEIDAVPICKFSTNAAKININNRMTESLNFNFENNLGKYNVNVASSTSTTHYEKLVINSAKDSRSDRILLLYFISKAA